MIDVEHRDRHRLPAFSRSADRLFERKRRPASVGNARQLIGFGHDHRLGRGFLGADTSDFQRGLMRNLSGDILNDPEQGTGERRPEIVR